MGDARGIFEAKSEDFHLKEYESLRREIDLLAQEIRALERNAIVAIGVTWGWLYSKHMPAWTYSIPCMFSVLGAIRAYGIEQTFAQIGGYVREIEIAFRKEGGPMGWEHRTKGTVDSKGALLFWIILNLSTIIVAGLRIISPVPDCPQINAVPLRTTSTAHQNSL